MRILSTVSLFVPLATFLSACGPPQTSMDAVATDLGVHVTELEAELNGHSTGAAGSASMSAIAELDGRHRTKTLELLTKLDEMVGHMGMCMNDAKAAPALGPCKAAIDELMSVAELHTSKVAGMAGLPEARAEEQRHHTEAGTQMAVMKTQSATMKELAMKYMCPASGMGGH